MIKFVMLFKLVIIFLLITSIAVSKEKNTIQQSKKRLTILPFTATNIEQDFAQVLRDYVEVSLFETHSYEILERKDIEAIKKEFDLYNKECRETGCAVEIGRLLSTDFILIGSIAKVDDGISISLKFIDVSSGKVLYTETISMKTKKEALSLIKAFAAHTSQKLNQMLNGSAHKKNSFPSIGYYGRGLVPGWSQLYAGNNLKGSVMLGAFGVTSAYTAYALYNFKHKLDEYKSLSGQEQNVYDRKRKQTKKALQQVYISCGTLAGIYAINLADIFLFTRKPDNHQARLSWGNVHAAFLFASSELNLPTLVYGASVGIRF